jgi:hypothetical protein
MNSSAQSPIVRRWAGERELASGLPPEARQYQNRAFCQLPARFEHPPITQFNQWGLEVLDAFSPLENS